MVRTLTRANGLSPEDLLQSGLDHFRASILLFETSPSYFDSAGYLAHMSAELLLKAWLLQAVGHFNAIHSLRDLYQQLVTSNNAASLSAPHQRVLDLLDKYDQLRYPNLTDPIEVGDDDLPMIADFMHHVVDSLPAPLRQVIANANSVEKGGRKLYKKKIDSLSCTSGGVSLMPDNTTEAS